MSGENYVTSSLVIVMIHGLLNVCSELLKQDFHEEVRNVILKLEAGVKTRFANYENSNSLAICTILDPRLKTYGFSQETTAENAKKIVANILAQRETGTNAVNICAQQVQNNERHRNEFSIWASFDRTVAAARPVGTPTSRALVELRRYVEEPVLPRNCDPLLWWRENQHMYPNLASIVPEKFCIPATSVPCERLFSKAGYLLQDRRTRLSTEKVSQIMFINTNLRLVNNK